MVRPAFTGTQRKLVIAFDVGTTFSGVSYSILDPGIVPELKGVTRFPAHETVGASKIPTIIYYDSKGEIRAVGAEATQDGILEAAEEGKWVKAEWFKLHLRSKTGKSEVSAKEVPPLPPKKAAVQVFADFLRYLLTCTKNYIEDAHVGGPQLWQSVATSILFVLSHPNGWEGPEQSQMRRAAVLAGLIPNNRAGHARISFVTEGEASLHFAIQTGILNKPLQAGEGVVFVDAGGGTIDVSAYRRCDSGVTEAHTFEEIAVPQCRFNGSVFVTINAKIFLKEFLADSPFCDDLEHIAQCFDGTTKLRFNNEKDPQYIKFGSTRDHDADHDIRFGQLKLAGPDVAAFFQASVDCIVDAVLGQQAASSHALSHIVLVGGFSASNWLVKNIKAGLSASGLSVLRPESNPNKAVSDGAVSFYLDHFVRSRMSRFAYGVSIVTPFNPRDAEHRKRSSASFASPSGLTLVPGLFTTVLPKNEQISETKEFRVAFSREWFPRPDPGHTYNHSLVLLRYQGDVPKPVWIDEDDENFLPACTITASLPQHNLRSGLTGKLYYSCEFKVVLLFGLTELKAQIVWIDKGVEKRGPATIVYDLPETTAAVTATD